MSYFIYISVGIKQFMLIMFDVSTRKDRLTSTYYVLMNTAYTFYFYSDCYTVCIYTLKKYVILKCTALLFPLLLCIFDVLCAVFIIYDGYDICQLNTLIQDASRTSLSMIFID